MAEFVNLDKKGPVGIITMNRPPANTYNLDFMKELDAAVEQVRFDDEVKGVILTSAIPSFFSAGADINLLNASTPEYKASFCLYCQEVLNRMEVTPKIFIAAINGHCVGGGLEIALACDLRFMATGKGKTGLPEVKLGVLPGTGGTQRLPRLIGRSRALDLMITGTTMSAEEALNIGLINRVFPPEELMSKTVEYVEGLAKGATRSIGLIKLGVQQGIEMSLSCGLTLERELQNRLFVTEDAKEGISAFLEKREPRFKGR